MIKYSDVVLGSPKAFSTNKLNIYIFHCALSLSISCRVEESRQSPEGDFLPTNESLRKAEPSAACTPLYSLNNEEWLTPLLVFTSLNGTHMHTRSFGCPPKTPLCVDCDCCHGDSAYLSASRSAPRSLKVVCLMSSKLFSKFTQDCGRETHRDNVGTKRHIYRFFGGGL